MNCTRRGFTSIELLVVVAVMAVAAAIILPAVAKARDNARMTQCLNNQRQIALAILVKAQDNNDTFPSADTVWGDINMPPKTLICPNADGPGTNSYGYSAGLAGKPMGRVEFTAQTPLLADCVEGAGNLLFLPTDIARRHTDRAVVVFVDGHTEPVKASIILGGYDLFADINQWGSMPAHTGAWTFTDPAERLFRANIKFVDGFYTPWPADSNDLFFGYSNCHYSWEDWGSHPFLVYLPRDEYHKPALHIFIHDTTAHHTLVAERELTKTTDMPTSLPVRGWVMGFEYGAHLAQYGVGQPNAPWCSNWINQYAYVDVLDDQDNLICRLEMKDESPLINDESLTFQGESFVDDWRGGDFNGEEFYLSTYNIPQNINNQEVVWWGLNMQHNYMQIVGWNGRISLYTIDPLEHGRLRYSVISKPVANWNRPARLKIWIDGQEPRGVSETPEMGISELTYFWF